MNFKSIQPFIEKSAKSSNPKVKKAAESLSDQMVNAQQVEEIAQPTLHAQEQNKPLNSKPKDEIDVKIDQWMPDVTEPEPNKSEFGKAAAAYCADIAIGALPKKTQEDIFRFTPFATKTDKVVQYSMVVEELLPKADKHNLESATLRIKKNEKEKGRKAQADKFQSKILDKYILILNDKIVDGHHFLSLAKLLGISCSLNVLDLTPLRFQQKTASTLFQKLAYVLQNNRR
jgi:hypothetical protein